MKDLRSSVTVERIADRKCSQCKPGWLVPTGAATTWEGGYMFYKCDSCGHEVTVKKGGGP